MPERMSAWCCHKTLIKKQSRLLSLDVALIGGLLIMVSKESARWLIGQSLFDWCFSYEARILCLSTSQLSKKKKRTHTVPDDKWEHVEMISLKYWIDPHTVHGSMNKKWLLIIKFCHVNSLRRGQRYFACMNIQYTWLRLCVQISQSHTKFVWLDGNRHYSFFALNPSRKKDYCKNKDTSKKYLGP